MRWVRAIHKICKAFPQWKNVNYLERHNGALIFQYTIWPYNPSRMPAPYPHNIPFQVVFHVPILTFITTHWRCASCLYCFSYFPRALSYYELWSTLFSPNPTAPSHTALNGWTAPQRLVTRQKCDKCTLQAFVKRPTNPRRPRTHGSQPAIEPTFNWSSTFNTLHLMLLWKGFFSFFLLCFFIISSVIRVLPPSANGGVCSQTQIHCWPLPTWHEQK